MLFFSILTEMSPFLVAVLEDSFKIFFYVNFSEK